MKDRETEEQADFLDALESVTLNGFSEVRSWKLENSGIFTSRSLTASFRTTGIIDCKVFYLSVWKGYYSKNVGFFIWELGHSCSNRFDRPFFN